jgi:hypothetical protein
MGSLDKSPLEAAMQTCEIQVQPRPVLTSYDSSQECSLDNWMRVYWLVEDEMLLLDDEAGILFDETTETVLVA